MVLSCDEPAIVDDFSYLLREEDLDQNLFQVMADHLETGYVNIQ
jgi:hypothetical protein